MSSRKSHSRASFEWFGDSCDLDDNTLMNSDQKSCLETVSTESRPVIHNGGRKSCCGTVTENSQSSTPQM